MHTYYMHRFLQWYILKLNNIERVRCNDRNHVSDIPLNHYQAEGELYSLV